MLQEFKKFAIRGNVMDMAIGIIIGAAFGAIVTSLVNDVLMPPIGLLLGNVDFSSFYLLLKSGDPVGPYPTINEARTAGAVVLAYGKFINAILSFLIVAFAVFMFVRSFNEMKKKEEEKPAAPTTKDCPYCFTKVPIKATKCSACTSELPAA